MVHNDCYVFYLKSKSPCVDINSLLWAKDQNVINLQFSTIVKISCVTSSRWLFLITQFDSFVVCFTFLTIQLFSLVTSVD